MAALAAHLNRRHEVTLFVASDVPAQTINAVFGIDLSGVEIVPLGQSDHAGEIVRRRPDLFINNSHASNLSNPAPRGIYMCMFPEIHRPVLATYQVVTANSQYTAKWIATRWGCPAEVVYSVL